MAKKAKKEINHVPIDMDDMPETAVESVVEPVVDEVWIAPAESTPVEPAPDSEPLEPGEVIRGKHEEPVHSFRVGDVTYHHIRNAADGRWIYAPIRP